ncbi:craniofacial development protein 2-like [Diorhabda sublineata]|uniref:craniofacial development protein 2-like n=1 Tax=Diorhabda sublineata TaxID=1163346 RepID=UPI0024E0B452|nr:craniofacial development protein 2-like [Diorhabda sublineata]
MSSQLPEDMIDESLENCWTTAHSKWTFLKLVLTNRRYKRRIFWAACFNRTITLASETGRSIDDDTARKRKKRVWKENIVRLGSWNITSWSNKDYEVVVEIEKNKIDFCAFSETKKKGNGSQRYQNYILLYSGVDKNLRARGGVGLLVNKKFEKDIKEVQYISHSIIQITVELADECTHLLSIYAPDVSKPKEEREAFFDALQAIPSIDKVFIMGDFNSRIGNTVIPGIMHSFNEGAVNDNRDILIDVCALNELRINNTYFDHKEQQEYTFANRKSQKSTIDFIITNRKVHPSQILDVRVLTSAPNTV